jgi:hypothetical protein
MIKKGILVSIFFINFVYAKGQTYLALPDSNASWTIESLDGSYMGYIDFLYSLPYNKQDTIINSKKYTKFPNKGAFRNDSAGITYFIPQDSTNEYVLQDLTKNAGDSVYNVICTDELQNFSIYNFYVDSVNHITIGPYTLKRMYLTNGSIPLNCSGWSQIIWVEKVGCMTGGFFNLEPCYLGAPFGSSLACMSYNDTIYYSYFYGNYSPSTYYNGTCNTILKTTEFYSQNGGIKLSPNPIESESLISLDDLDDLIIEIVLYNSQGIKVKNKRNLKNTELILKKNEFIPGIYIANVSTKKLKKYSIKFIVL